MATENLTELGLLFTEEGYDSLIDKVKKVGDAVQKLTAEDEARVQASAKVAKATSDLSNQLDRTIVSYAGSKSAILEYKAEQIGATSALEKQIALLRELEEHTRLQADAFRSRQQDLKNETGLEQDKIRDIQLRIKIEEQAATEAARLAEQQIKNAKRVQDAENATFDKAIAERLKARQREVDMYAKMAEQMSKDIQKGKETEAKAVFEQTNKAIALAERQAIEEIAWANKSLKGRIAALQELQKYQANSNISPETAAAKFGAGAIKDLPNLTAMQAAYKTEVAATEVVHAKQAGSLKSISQLWGEVSLNTSRARSELIVLGHEAIQGRFSRIPASMLVFAEYSNLSALATSALGIAVLGTVGAIAAITYAIIKGQLEFTKFNAALILTGGYSGLTASNFNVMAAAITKTHGTIGEAKQALLLLAESGKFTTSQIATIAPAIVDMAHASGQALDKLVQQFTKLAEDPVKASKQLNEEYHYLTGTIYEQIKALEDQGNKQAAVDLAEREFAAASNQRAEQIREHLGWFERGWNAVTRAVSSAGNALKSLGVADTTGDKLASAIAARDKLQSAITNETAVNPVHAGALEELKDYNVQIGNLTRQAITERLAAAATANKKLIQQDDINSQDRLKAEEEKNLTPLEQRQKREAIVYQAASSRIAGILEASGKVNLSVINQANAKELLEADANKKQIVDSSKDRYNKLLATAQQYGVDITKFTARIGKDIQDIQERRRDRAVKETSFVELEKLVQDQEREYQAAVKHSERMLQQSNKRFNADKVLAEDSLSVARNESKTKSAIHLEEATVYTDYIQKIKVLNTTLLTNQLAELDTEVAAGQRRTDNIVKQANEQVAKTADGQLRRTAIIKKARDEQAALVESRNDRAGAFTERAADSIAEAEAKASKEALADVNLLIQATDRKLVQKQKEVEAIGLTKQRVRELADLENSQNTVKIKAQIATEQAAQSDVNLSKTEVQLYQDRIDKLQILYEKTLKLADIDVLLKARQADWQAGAVEGFHNYLDNVDNVFDSARKLSEQSFKGMEDAMTTFVSTGKLSFASLFSQLGTGLARLYIQSKLLGPIANVLNGGSNGSGRGNNFFDNIVSGAGKFLGLGSTGYTGLGGATGSALTMGFGGTYAAGGNPPVGMPYIVGEKGPEWHIDRTASTILPNGQSPGGQGLTVNNYFTLQQPADRRTQDQIATMAGQSIQRAMARNT
jgi:lambda family phage tail tape measure protein